MNIFVNEGIHNGILNYLKASNNQSIDRVHIFEFWITKMLVSIYGEPNIINPYKLNEEAGLKKNFAVYGLKPAEIDQFIVMISEYNSWLNSPHLVTKTNLPSQIETLLINMILLKASCQEIPKDELEYYSSFFDPLEGDMAKYNDLVVADKTIIPNLWRTEKLRMESGLVTDGIKPELLPASDYKRYGLSINEVRKLSNAKIRELNARIMAEETAANAGEQTKFDPKKLILTSGSGFVDTIVLLGIMATEILVGLLIAFTFMKG